MILLLLLLLQQPPQNKGMNTRPDDPTFEIAKSGHWHPYCPAGTDMIRMDVQPPCYWGNAEMTHKPTLDQFKCIHHKWYKAKPKKCGVDQYFNVGIGLH